MLLDRFGATPVFLTDVARNAVAVHDAWPGTPGTGTSPGAFRSALGGISRTDERAAGFQAMLVARLRGTCVRYPADASLAELVDELRSTSRSTPCGARRGQSALPITGPCSAVPRVAEARSTAPCSTSRVTTSGWPSVVRVGQAGPG